MVSDLRKINRDYDLARGIHYTITRAADALESTSRALSEKEGELAEVRERTKRSVSETRAFWDALVPKGPMCRDCADFDGRCQGDGPPCDPQAHALENLAKLIRQRDEALAALKASEEREAGLREALGPFAHVAKTESKLIRYSATGWNEADMTVDCDRAFSVLENGPASLADATKKDPGAEQREAGR